MTATEFHVLEAHAIAALRAAGFEAFYSDHAASLARGVAVAIGRRDRRIQWCSTAYIRAPIGFNYEEVKSGFTLHAGNVCDAESAQALHDFVAKLIGADAADAALPREGTPAAAEPVATAAE